MVLDHNKFSLSDRLINDQKGTVKYIKINQNEVNTIRVAFEDVAAARIRINENDLIARPNKWVPIKRKKYQYSFINTR